MRIYFWLLIIYLNGCSGGLVAQKFVDHTLSNPQAPTSERYQSFTFNGAWCWFSAPRAVYFEGEYKRTYTGWVDNYGDLHVAYYDHQSEEIRSTVIFDNLEIDDHDNPSLLFDEQGRLLVFFNRHMQGVQPLYLIKAHQPESIDSWGEVKELHLNDEALKGLGSMNHTYTNPVKLSAENGRIFLFWRGVDGKPSYSFSDDNGNTWAAGKIFFMPERTYGFRRPYTKVYSDGKSKIHFVLTDGHPRKEKHNSLYYMYYEDGAFHHANGARIKNIGGEPVTPSEADKLYDASLTNEKAWNWDIASDEQGHPVIAYVKFPNDSTHIYCYARWDGLKWRNYDLINAGSWFPDTPAGIDEPEPNYSGGMSIDHEAVNTLYLSVNRDSVFEIEKWVTPDEGRSWMVERLTQGSVKNNIRPFAIRGAKADNPLQVLWMQNTQYYYFAYAGWLKKQMEGGFKNRFFTSIKMGRLAPVTDNPLRQKDIKNVMRRAADWQLANPRLEISPLDWHYGALYTGIRALYELTGEERYLNELFNVGQAHNWRPLDDFFNADRLTVIDNWAWLYGLLDDPDIIEKARWVLDAHLARDYPQLTDVRFIDNPYRLEWWTWCDALFMAPPVYVKMANITGNEKYVAFMDKEFKATHDFLYDKEEHLFYRDRRYFPEKIREANGQKVFWGRGNGWVMGGLVSILKDLPQDSKYRPFLRTAF